MVKSEEEVIEEFEQLVNMTADEISQWLDTDESKEVGMVREGEDESVGHQSGRRIIEILSHDEYTEDDLAHMRKVVSYIKRHSAQQPDKDDLKHTHWTYSLKNWGHNPMK
ncbi:hypothetical protein AKO1_001957 [Acrasis kona]|uniref:DNA-binding protein n=1 Tax=Acrasis kona TaxID=1008807 RepID=A0AAW2ZBL3_9EUKA